MWMHWLRIFLLGPEGGVYGYLPQRVRARHSALLHYSRLR
jgi:hypothetical protein